MAIAVFAGFTLIALFATALQDGADSKERFQAASIAEALISARRAAPIAANIMDASGAKPLPLPALNANTPSLAKPTYLTWDGAVTDTTGTNGPARFCLIYNTVFNPIPAGAANTGNSVVYLCLYWPPTPLPPGGARSGHFEVTTTFTLPPS